MYVAKLFVYFTLNDILVLTLLFLKSLFVLAGLILVIVI